MHGNVPFRTAIGSTMVNQKRTSLLPLPTLMLVLTVPIAGTWSR